jgi:hypothetical protein
VTSGLDKLTVRDKYGGHDQVHSMSDAGMEINHIGSSILRTPSSNIHLRKILHVPQASKNLLSLHRLDRDNNAFLEFHPHHFFIKEQGTKKVILKGRCEGGLYPLKHASSRNKHVFAAIKPSSTVWHHLLGHASAPVVRQVLNRHKLPFVLDPNKNMVCDACQMGKSHQLRYPRSTSMSTRPLELVFSDVWGPAPSPVGRHSYHVSFIDDFSEFTWIYFIHHKSEVFKCFQEFQQLVERQFDCKILAMQTDWGVNISPSTNFLHV